MFNYNTDMADERRDIFKKTNNIDEIPGVEVESIEETKNIKTNRVIITTKEGEQALGKPIGTYITIDVKDLKIAEKKDIDEASRIVTKELSKLINKHIKKD